MIRLKHFFIPKPAKVLLSLALLLISALLTYYYVTARISDTFPFGFPLQFFVAWGPCRPGMNCSEFNLLWLVGDIVFWYTLSAGVVAMFGRKAR
jgi:hypothetical protein